MRIGLLAYSTNTGLGYQTYEFYKHMSPVKTLVVDLAMYNMMETHHDRYPDARLCRGIPSNNDMEWLTDDIDVVFVCETPLNYHLFTAARRKGVLSIQQYNYEFLDYFDNPSLPKPDILAAPTTWNTDKIKALNIARVMDWPVPIDRDNIPFREITECNTFVHIAGRPAAYDRNGTLDFIQAANDLGDSFNYILYIQPPKDNKSGAIYKQIDKALRRSQVPIAVVENIKNNAAMYETGDVVVLPRRYGGLCLPAREALSAGMPVIMPNISPNNSLLPGDWLSEAEKYMSFIAHTEIDVYRTKNLEQTMLMFADSKIMSSANFLADMIADKLSWDVLKPRYLEWMEDARKDKKN